MQTMVIRSTNNEFKFESGKIVDTKLVLIVSDPDRSARVTLSHGDYFDFRSSTIEVATEDGMPCDTPINFFSFIAMTNSNFKGTLSTFREIVLKSNSTINRLNAHGGAVITTKSGTIRRFHDYRYSASNFSYEDFVKYVDRIKTLNIEETPVLHHQESYHMLNEHLRRLRKERDVRLEINPDSARAYRLLETKYLKTNESGRIFLTNMDLSCMPGYNREIHIRNESETNPITIVVKNPAEQFDFFINNVAIFAEDATIIFENLPKALFIRNSILPTLEAKDAEIHIYNSKIDTLKVKTPHFLEFANSLQKIKNSYILYLETMF